MKILLATDGSVYSEIAAGFLSHLELSPDDEILILHVLSWGPYHDERESYYVSLKYFKEKIAPRILDSALNILKPLETRISTALVEGAPDKAIIDAATESGADLIVMGARGIKGIKSLFIGSVTRSVATNSPIPVLVTKPLLREVPGRLKVLFATDGSDSAQATAELLASIPFPDDTELLIMNVVWSAVSDIPERFILEIDDKIKEDVARVRQAEFERSSEIIEQARPYLEGRFSKIEGLTKAGDPSMEILHAAGIFGADLIAVGCRGLRGIRGMMGSVSRRILSQSQSPVLIGKLHERQNKA
ncbi:MAG: universal stress protein [Nitrospirae bacterium]|nr:universal stress protein [Nitrospirota bacterium]